MLPEEPLKNTTINGICADGWVLYSDTCNDIESLEEHILNAWETEGVVQIKIEINRKQFSTTPKLQNYLLALDQEQGQYLQMR